MNNLALARSRFPDLVLDAGLIPGRECRRLER